MFVGEDPLEVERLWEVGYALTRWYGRKGVAISALGGIDTALWDIRGKVAGRPLYKLLGAQRDRVPAYASALAWRERPSELAEEAARHLAAGFRAMKMRIGKTYEYDRTAVRVVRAAIGQEVSLMVDANSRFTLAHAERISSDLRANKVFWLEEPFPAENIASYVSLRPTPGIAMAAGENDFGVQGFRELIECGAVDIVQPDCSRAGGITECRRIALLAAQSGLPVATHTWSDAVALIANMHLVASLENGLFVEVDQTGNALISELTDEPLQVVDGEIALPRRPGLGIELNEVAIERYTVPKTCTVPEGNYSDMVFGRRHYARPEPYGETGGEISRPAGDALTS